MQVPNGEVVDLLAGPSRIGKISPLNHDQGRIVLHLAQVEPRVIAGLLLLIRHRSGPHSGDWEEWLDVIRSGGLDVLHGKDRIHRLYELAAIFLAIPAVAERPSFLGQELLRDTWDIPRQ